MVVDGDLAGGSLTVELDPQTWALVDDLGLFGLDPANRGPGQVSGDGAVRVTLQPAGDDRKLHTEGWRALTVTEVERDEGPVQLRAGFATRWHHERSWHPLLDDLTAFFTVRDVPIDRVEGPEPVLYGDGDGRYGSWLLTVRADESTRVVTLESVTAELAGEAAGALAARLDGADDARVDAGRLVVSHRWTAPHGTLDEDAFAEALATHLARTDDLLGT